MRSIRPVHAMNISKYSIKAVKLDIMGNNENFSLGFVNNPTDVCWYLFWGNRMGSYEQIGWKGDVG